MQNKTISAGLVYFYLCGTLKDNQIALEVVDSYHNLPEGFYKKIRCHLFEKEAIGDMVHVFGVIGNSEKVNNLSSIIKNGFDSNVSNLLNGKRIKKSNRQLDELGNTYFKIIQEFFLEEPGHFPYAVNHENDEWTVSCVWCSNAAESKIHVLANSTFSIWLENEVPTAVGKQLMLRSFFVRDFANRKVLACIPKSGSSEWQLLFEGGTVLSLGEEDYYKGTASPNSLGFFSISGIDNMLTNPAYSFGIILYPDDISAEWHKVFLFACAISDIEWTAQTFEQTYKKFLDFLQHNICDRVDASSFISKEQGIDIFLIKIQNVRNFLKGEDEPVISKDLFLLLNSRYVYLPYILDIVPVKTSVSENFLADWVSAQIHAAEENKDTYEKGTLWEDVAEYILKRIPGWRITGRRIRAGSQEIDISVANVSTDDCLWQLGSYILVECKNWKQHVTLPQIRNIAYISSMKGNKCALLFATNGITREAKKEVLRLAATGIYILVITKEDLLELSCEQDCYSMIISKFEDLENNQDNIPV